MKKPLFVAVLLLASAVLGFSQDRHTLLQKPTVSRTHIAFVYAGDIWLVPRDGGAAERLTTGTGIESFPLFSPDGTQIAFTGQYDGNTDVYVVPAGGGTPKRLTYHPGADVVVAWTPDGKSLLFRSGRASNSPRYSRLFKMSLDGGLPEEMPLPMGFDGSFSPDGTRLAYMPLQPAFQQWKNYHGGQQTKIWIAELADSSWAEIPRTNANDFNPMWIGDRVYFLSDRSGPVSLFSYDTKTKKVTPTVPNDGLDIKSASAGPDVIAYERFGNIHLYDLKTGKARPVEITVSGDLPGVRPRFEKVAANIAYLAISPTGARAVFGARGEILTVPAEKGDVRNLTKTPGVMERDPAWSPDGRWIAYFSDESGEYALHLREQNGMGEVKKIGLGSPSSFFYSPVWSPDSKKIAFTDKRLNLWYVELEKGSPVKVDTTSYENPFSVLDPAWSPDSKWLTYTKQLKNHLGAVFVYSLESARATQITDGLSDSRFASFDRNGKYLYFTSSTDIGPSTGWLDMSSFPVQVTRSAYVAVLAKGEASPLAPESDEEKVQEEKKPQEKPAEKKEAATVKIDFDGIGQRILALPIPARNYAGMVSGKSGILFLLESVAGQPGSTVHRFDISKRKPEKILDGVGAFDLSANGEKILFAQGNFGAPGQPPRFTIAPAMTPMKPGEGALNLADLEVYVDPKAEWQQMYHEVWRLQRDFFYDPSFHGLDIRAAEKKYEPFLSNVAHRADLTYLFQEMLGNMSVGHHNAGGGDLPQPKGIPGGLLGADYKIENGRYRFARIYNGENWNPQLRAPLTQPGVDVQTGEYLLAVNGRDVRATDDVYAFFENTANKSIVIRVGPNADGTNSREVTVVPIGTEVGLRNLAWIEGNRRKVDELSGGKVGYVYLPDTAGGGFTNFNRYYFAQIDKQGAVIDERFNGGGTAADYIVDYMRRPLMNYWTTREGEDFTTPVGSIFGPKAMIINEYAGSGGDLLPWLFRKAGVGQLVGKRTWGGLVGIYTYPQLMDGGQVTAPRVAFYNTEGAWDVENHGTAPDIEVELDPKVWRSGRDPQLERAVQVVMDGLKINPPPKAKKPAYPNYYPGTAGAASGTAPGSAKPGRGGNRED
ncbi:MAG: PDZ domain-containing protein [Acidobacteriota bacterium]